MPRRARRRRTAGASAAGRGGRLKSEVLEPQPERRSGTDQRMRRARRARSGRDIPARKHWHAHVRCGALYLVRRRLNRRNRVAYAMRVQIVMTVCDGTCKRGALVGETLRQTQLRRGSDLRENDQSGDTSPEDTPRNARDRARRLIGSRHHRQILGRSGARALIDIKPAPGTHGPLCCQPREHRAIRCFPTSTTDPTGAAARAAPS